LIDLAAISVRAASQFAEPTAQQRFDPGTRAAARKLAAAAL
jgi:hypothetical protein